ncbi:glutathione S-transferase [Roseobacter sp. YSTF-M11]|uniref:Glutathione S-transferase n=1 Tax=Roseobacter insulae TaxID=2859783 RepID=A0A9X1FSQ0_9RHOB|nr:glutathione S-transferase [Roseobacter insulae]MBW4707079.1 glutathione S-transferase [Roseobacter insulae]
MKLFHSPASPFVRKVVVLLHELDRAADVELVGVTSTAFATDEGLAASNPLAKIPALVRDNGTTLYDSRVITAYLNDLFGGNMYPSGTSRWETLTLEATGDGIMDCAVSMAYEARLRPEEMQYGDWIEAQWAKVSRAISVLNARWISHLSGPMDIGHISVACALSYVEFRHGARNWRAGNEALANWHAGFDSRASMQATIPPAG